MTEAERFLNNILLQDHSVVELLTSDQTFLNNRLATHYGINTVPRRRSFRQVTLTDPVRFGLLGKARGPVAHVLWRSYISGAARSVGAGQDYRYASDAALHQTWKRICRRPPAKRRRRFVRGSKCIAIRRAASSATAIIDPTGLALENFDVTGQFRKTDRQANNTPIDASTMLPNGIAINGPAELRGTAGGPSGNVRAGVHGTADDVQREPAVGIFRYSAGS